MNENNSKNINKDEYKKEEKKRPGVQPVKKAPQMAIFVWLLIFLSLGILFAYNRTKKDFAEWDQSNFEKELACNANREHMLCYQFKGIDNKWNQSATTSFTPFKWLHLPESKLSMTVGSADGRTWIDVTARAFAKFVWLELKSKDAIFSDNAFDLLSGETRRVWIERGESNPDVIRRELNLSSFRDTF